MTNESDVWWAQTVEEPIDATRPIVDPHHHLWDGDDPARVRGFGVNQLAADTARGHNIVSTVFVECMAEYRSDGPEHLRPVGETEFVAQAAEALAERGAAPIGGIVSFADLTLGVAVEEVLAAHEEAGAGLFRGIRHASGWLATDEVHNSHTNPPEGLLGQPTFREGLAKLGSMGYSFDAWLYHPQLSELADLARAHPEVPIVLDHIGAPMGVGPYTNQRDEVRAEWQPAMREIAACDNVVLKVGGIGMARYYGGDWPERDEPPTSEELAAYWGDELRWCIDTFGPSRCMFESNFPVDRESCSYTVLWNVFQRVGAHYSSTEQDDLFQGTATRTYRL